MAKLIAGVANDKGAIYLHKTTDGFRFFIKEDKYAFVAGVTLQEQELRKLHREISNYLDTGEGVLSGRT